MRVERDCEHCNSWQAGAYQSSPELWKAKAKKAIKELVGGEPAPRVVDPNQRAQREERRDWPSLAHTMIGLKRMENLQFRVEDVIRKNVPGDFIETGVWRGVRASSCEVF